MTPAAPPTSPSAKCLGSLFYSCTRRPCRSASPSSSPSSPARCATSARGRSARPATAMLGFEEYIEPLKVYLQKYREVAILGEPRVLYGEAKQQLTTPTCNSR